MVFVYLCLGGDMSPLLLDIAKIDAEHDLHEANRTMRISESGSINIGGFEIRRTGLYSFTTNQDKPEQDKEPQGPSSDSDGIRNRVMENVQESIAPLAMLGRGASGVVWKAIHVPTMKVSQSLGVVGLLLPLVGLSYIRDQS